MKNAIIIDIDGTISDDRHRLHLIGPAGSPTRYDAYHTAMSADKPMNRGIVELCFKIGAEPVFITSRPEQFRRKTQNWLTNHFFCGDLVVAPLILMRPKEDLRPSRLLKSDLVSHFEGQAELLVAFDDRPDVLSAYRSLNIPTVRVCYESLDTVNAAAVTPSVPDLLRAGAKTFEERNAVYGETYEIFGRVMAQLFPEGLRIAPGDTSSFNRLGVYVQILTKIARYATSLGKGLGHVDSAHDSMVYSAMLEYLTRK